MNMLTETQHTSRRHDGITKELIQSSLDAIAQEMFATMRKTAMSSIIYEVLDFGVAITDAKGYLTSSGAGIPGFVGMLDAGIQEVLKKFDAEDIQKGDVFATNIPHRGGVSHMNDVVLMMPVFCGEQCIAWVANKAHWVDIGGMSPGSIDPNATEIFQEGLQIPEIKVIEGGEAVDSILDLIAANSRLPETTMGDFWAGVASIRSGDRRIVELANKYGAELFHEAVSDYLDYGESVTLRALKTLPNGEYHAEDWLDDGRRLVATITITDDNFIVDLRGNPPQDPGPFNASFAGTLVDAQIILKAVTDPQSVANAGSFRPLKLICDEQSIVNSKPPAAMGLYYETSIRVFDLLWKALAPVMPDRLTAGHYASVCGTIIGGVHPDTGQTHSFIEPEIGGWGAGNDEDGDNAQYTGFHGETFNCPAEINESRNGIIVDRFELNTEPGGDGEFVGGRGIVLDYRIRSNDWWITAMYSRGKYPPWGLNGGQPGTSNRIEILRHDGTVETYNTCSGLELNKDDVVRIITATGGGYGDPNNRDIEQSALDQRNGFLTAQSA